jgi:phosphoribosyl 1,2-cyclic phosphodiesterase
VFITHDHADHIKAAGHLAGKHNIPVYSTPEVHRGMRRSYCMTDKIDDAHAKFIHKGETIAVEDFEITCFEVPHDGTDNVGYTIRIDGKTFSFLTDIGHITETAAAHIVQSNYLVLEANYDKIGPAEHPLKRCFPAPLPIPERKNSGSQRSPL